jgi:hypothetical protein
MFAVNLFAAHGLLAAALPYLKQGAAMVCISSVNAVLPPRGAVMYGASKAALELWVRGAAKELGPQGIRINAIAPGPVDGDRLAGLGGKPGLFERRGRLILENKRLNAVYAATIKAVRRGENVETILGRLARNDTVQLSHDKAVPAELRESASPSREQALEVLRRYHFRWALVLFPVFVGVRILAGRLYAGTILEGVRSGAIGEEDLEESEWQALRRLDLITPRPVVERPRWRRAAAWLGTRSGRFTARTLTFGVWMLLGVMILVSEFLRYSGGGGGAPGRGWWNQPMIQVPWMNWTPGHLREKEPSEP